MEFDGKGDGVLLTGVESFHRFVMLVTARRRAHIHPSRGSRYPVLDGKRRFRMFQLIPNDGGQDHSVKQSRKDIDMANQQQVIDRTRVGDDEPHPSESQTLKS